MKLSISSLFFIFIISFLILIIAWLYRENTYLKKTEFTIGQKLESAKSNVHSLLGNEYIRFQNYGLSIDKGLNLKSEEDTTSFVELVEKYNKLLIFRYSELNCMACVEKEIIYLIDFVERYNTKLVILSSYTNERDLYLFKRINRISDYIVYNIEEGVLKLPVENLNIPYYFVLDSNYRAINLFVPDKNFPERSVKYLNSIAKKY